MGYSDDQKDFTHQLEQRKKNQVENLGVLNFQKGRMKTPAGYSVEQFQAEIMRNREVQVFREQYGMEPVKIQCERCGVIHYLRKHPDSNFKCVCEDKPNDEFKVFYKCPAKHGYWDDFRIHKNAEDCPVCKEISNTTLESEKKTFARYTTEPKKQQIIQQLGFYDETLKDGQSFKQKIDQQVKHKQIEHEAEIIGETIAGKLGDGDVRKKRSPV